MGKPVLLSVPGSAGLYPLIIGATLALNQLIKEGFPDREVFYGGVSSGCFGAIIGALDLQIHEVEEFHHKFSSFFNTWDIMHFTQYHCFAKKLLTEEIGE